MADPAADPDISDLFSGRDDQPAPPPPPAAAAVPSSGAGPDVSDYFSGNEGAEQVQIDPETGVPVSIQRHPWAAHIANITGSIIDGLPYGHLLRQAIDHSIAQTPEARQRLQQTETAMQQAHPYETWTGGAIGSTVGYGALMAAAPEMFGMGQMAGMSMATRTTASAITNAVLQGTDALSRGDDPVSAGVFGALMGGAGPAVGDRLAKLFSNTVIPQTTRLADQFMNRWGIPIRADAGTNNPMIKLVSKYVDFSPFSGGAGPPLEESLGKWRQGISTLIGENTPNITQDVFKNAQSRLGAAYDAIYAQARPMNILNDKPFQGVFRSIADEITGKPTMAWKKSQITSVKNMLETVANAFDPKTGELSVKAYKSLTDEGSVLGKMVDSTDRNIQKAAINIRDGLTDMMKRNLPATARGQLSDVDGQYWIMKSIEPVIARHSDGMFSPQEIMDAALKNIQGKAYGGGGPASRSFADLADGGMAFLKSAPDQAAEQSYVQRAIGSIAHGVRLAEVAGIPYAAAHFIGGHPLGAAAAVGSIALGRAAGSVLRRSANRLVQGAMGGRPVVPPTAQFLAKGALPAFVAGARPLAAPYLGGPAPQDQSQ